MLGLMELLESGRGGPMFRWLGEPLAIDLANTVLVVKPGDVRDLLATREQLTLWLDRQRERLADGDVALAHPAEVGSLRDAIRRLLAAGAQGRPLPADDVNLVNALSAATATYPQVAVTRGGRARLVERSVTDDRLANLLGRIARSVIELLAGPERDRLRICRAPNCGMFFLANPSRPGQRWCCAACGNRARVAAHYRHHVQR
jgi:predicted RNA-binding Zn ribbon-like protein